MVTEAEARRLRPLTSGLVALAVALAATLAWYYLGRPSDSGNAVRTVDWKPWVLAGRSDKHLDLYAPQALPPRWRATSVDYVGGNFPDWSLGILTGAQLFVGLNESKDSVQSLAVKNMDPNAVQGRDTTINGLTWQTWTDSGGDYGVALPLKRTDGSTESVLVYGSAPGAQIRSFAASLRPGS
jgi:hypothetical protein